MENKLHFVYKITNDINGKIYIGVHSTDDINDGYLGKGTLIQKAVKKYGKSNFKKEILEFFKDRTSAFDKERELVTREFVSLTTNYNLKTGGEGGAMYGKTNPMYGRTYRKSESEKTQISLRFKNVPKTNQHKQNLSNSLLGKPRPDIAERQRGLLPWNVNSIRNNKTRLRKFADLDIIFDYWSSHKCGVKALANWYQLATYNELASVMRFIKKYGDPRQNDDWKKFKADYEY